MIEICFKMQVIFCVIFINKRKFNENTHSHTLNLYLLYSNINLQKQSYVKIVSQQQATEKGI